MLLITNANVITWESPNRLLADQALRIEDGLIREIDASRELEARYPQAERLDAGGQWVMPGNICAHTHFYGAFARGLAIRGAAPAEFKEILEKLWWRLDKCLTLEDVRYSALTCLVDAIKHGTTTLFDHHASPNAIDGSLDVLAEAVQQAGLRAALCYEVTDRDGDEKARAGMRENVRFLQRVQNEKPPMLAGAFGLHAALTLSNATLEACREAAPEGSGFHIHVAESPDDAYTLGIRYDGGWPVDWLYRFGILGDKTIAAHCVHIDEYEIKHLAETQTWVTHQPRSNMNNAVGVAAVEDMLEAGVKVCLGNDGFSNAMWEEWKTTYLLHKCHTEDPRRMGADRVVQMGVYHNAALASAYFPQAPIGVIQPGAAADLICVEYWPITPLNAGNLPWQIIFGFRDSMVTATIAGGKVLMKDRRLLTLDEAEIAANARALAQKVWQRYNEE